MRKYCFICQTWYIGAHCPECEANHKASINRDWKLANCVPDLLAALAGLLDMVTDNRLHGPEVDRAADALYKAREVTTNV